MTDPATDTMPSAALAPRHLDVSQATVARTPLHPDDYAVWPDGMYCTIDELDRFPWRSDDYEIVRQDDHERRTELEFDC